MTDETDQVREMLTAEQVLELIPISRSTLFRLERDGLFPQGQAITPHRKLWFKDTVAIWQRQLLDPTSPLSRALKLRVAKKKVRSRLPGHSAA
jgi:predicted DNA-binding transcriptional regulator AlpA